MEVSHDMLKRRAELADEKCEAFEANEGRLKVRLDALEKMYMDTSEENIKLREIEVDLRNEFEGGVSRKEFDRTSLKIKNMESQMEELEKDVAKCEFGVFDLYFHIPHSHLIRQGFG
jgi:hypothetical protein